MSHASHSLDPTNADAEVATFEGKTGCCAHVKVLDEKGSHLMVLEVGGQTIEVTEEEALDLRTQINRGRLFAHHQGAIVIGRRNRAEAAGQAERDRIEAENRRKAEAAQAAAAEKRAQALAAAKAAEEAEAAAAAAAEPEEPEAPEAPEAPAVDLGAIDRANELDHLS